MPAPQKTSTAADRSASKIDLRDAWLAGFLAWLVPGLGHMYQRRWGKGGLYMTCILGTFIYGLWLGGGRVVYASFREPDWHDWRWAYVGQVGVGLPALPAIVQAMRTGGPQPKAPLWGGFMAPPMLRGQIVPRIWIEQQQLKYPNDPEFDAEDYRAYDSDRQYYAYVPGVRIGEHPDQTSLWNYKLGAYYDLGTVFTMIAGLLNVLAIWDAGSGPVVQVQEPEKTEPLDGDTK